MATGALIGLTVGTAALGAYSSAQQASAANRLAERRQEAQIQAARIQSRQIGAQSALEKQKTSRQAHQIRSMLRVGAGERLGEGGTFEALLLQADLDEAINIAIIERNADMARESAFSRIQPLPPEQNPTLALILGGLGGIQSGLSLGTSALTISKFAKEPERTGGTA